MQAIRIMAWFWLAMLVEKIASVLQCHVSPLCQGGQQSVPISSGVSKVQDAQVFSLAERFGFFGGLAPTKKKKKKKGILTNLKLILACKKVWIFRGLGAHQKINRI
jgi:hypothetical protein